MATSWEPAAERERRLTDLHTVWTRLRNSRKRRLGVSLADAYADRPNIDRAELRQLAQQTYDGPVISLYLNFAPALLVRERPVFLSVFKALRHRELQERESWLRTLTQEQRIRMLEDMLEVQAFLEGFEPEDARSMALFKSGPQLNRAMALPVRTRDSLTIDIDPYEEPLEAILEENHRVLIADLSQEKATLSLYRLGHEEKIDSLEFFVPDTSRDASRPAKARRHRLTHLHWHLNSAAQLARRVFDEREGDLIALVGETAIVHEFEEFLPKPLRTRVFARLQLSPRADRNQRRSAIQAALDEYREREEREALADLGLYRAKGRLASGLPEVLEAANLLIIRQLFVSVDLARTGFVCRAHNYLSLRPGSCVFDSQPLVPADSLIDELIEVGRLHGAEVMVVRRRQDMLSDHGEIAAITLPVPLVDLVSGSDFEQAAVEAGA